MFRNQYDSDVTVWSPQGRLHQLDYAVEAMKQGSATVAIKSKTHSVVVALKRAANELSSHQKKICELDRHIGLSMAGLLSDGRILARFLQTECASYRWDFKSPAPIQILCKELQLKLQGNTQYYGRRPFGVGLILIGYDGKGAHVVKVEPSGEVCEMYASSIGARSQSARTYLERNADNFANATLDELIKHALLSLRGTLQNEEQLSERNTSIAIVGHDHPFQLIEDEGVGVYLNRLPPANE